MESLFVKAAELKRFQSHPTSTVHVLTQRWVGGRSFKIARRLVLDQNGNNMKSARKTTSLPPTKTMQVCASHTSALCSSSQSCSESRPPTQIMESLFVKAAELKRFQSHPLAQQSTGDEQEEFEESNGTEEFEALFLCPEHPRQTTAPTGNTDETSY